MNVILLGEVVSGWKWGFHTQNWGGLWGGVTDIPVNGKGHAVTAAGGPAAPQGAQGRWGGAAGAAAHGLAWDRVSPAVAALDLCLLLTCAKSSSSPGPRWFVLVFQSLLPWQQSPPCRPTPFSTAATSTLCCAPGSARPPPSMPPTSSTPFLSRE